MILAKLLNQSPYDFYFLVVDKFLSIDIPELSNFHSITSLPHLHNSGQLLAQTTTIDFITQNSKKTRHTPIIVPFKPSAKIEHLCQQHHWLLAANPAKLSRSLEDKLKFPQLCQNNQLPIIPFAVDTLTPTNFSKYQQLFTSQLVIQTHFGWAGKSTFSSDSYSKITKVIPPNTVVKFSPYIQGYSLLNNCCLTRYGLIQSPPALQYTGLKPFTPNPFATVGRQWPSFAPKHIQNQVSSITQSISLILSKLNYHGFFGLDFLVDQDRVLLLECNPRLTASFSFYTQLELQAKLEPLFYYHLAEFLNLDYPKPFDRFDNLNIAGSELTPKDINSKTIKQLRWSYPLVKTPNKIDLAHVQA
jgi:predicted ATP-grasp superfamily ATP-dependent carboligase